ncbi:MAG: EF-hand domain-containing protein [Verrucomicrobiales bacterium]
MKSTLSILLATIIGASMALAADEAKPANPANPDKPQQPENPERPRGNPDEAFKKLDIDKDGSISLEEYKASPRAKSAPDRAENSFKRRDKDSDGKLSLDEFKARGQRREKDAPPAKQ